MPEERWHVSARPWREGDRKRTVAIGAIIAAEDAGHAMMWLMRAVERQSFVNPELVPLRNLEALATTVERTDDGGE